jgi:hypothetical protein
MISFTSSDIASIFGIPFSIHFYLSSFSPWRFRWQNLIHHRDCLNQFRKSYPTIAYEWNAAYNWRYCKETISLWHAVITNTYVKLQMDGMQSPLWEDQVVVHGKGFPMVILLSFSVLNLWWAMGIGWGSRRMAS